VSQSADTRRGLNDLPLRNLVRIVGLVAVVATIGPESLIGRPRHEIPAAFAVGIVAASWVSWLVNRDRGNQTLTAVSLICLAVAGGILAPIAPAAIAVAAVVGVGAAMAFNPPVALGLVAVGPLTHLIAATIDHRSLVVVTGSAAAALGGIVIGVSRRQSQLRTEQLALVTLERQRAEVEHERAELLGERNRLAREIHDVLAHTLGAVSVQVAALDAVIDRESSEAVHARLQDTRRLVVQGLDEARRAVSALRDDAPALAEQLKELCARMDVPLTLAGETRPVTPHVALALFRIAQESLTNASKHAPGAAANVSVHFTPGAVSLQVRNERGHDVASPLATTGGGYGLQGMRERVLLLGGTLEAGPTDDGWLVEATLPA
jgi:signal transduction histidine kinase